MKQRKVIQIEVPEEIASALTAQAKELRIPYDDYIRVHRAAFIEYLEQVVGLGINAGPDYDMTLAHYTYPDRSVASAVAERIPLEVTFVENGKEWAGRGRNLD